MASYRGDEEFLQEEGADTEKVSDMMKLLASTGATDSMEELCDDPFKPKRRLYGTRYAKTRFSDGSFPVFYSSPEAWTAEAEVGSVKDLRPMQTEWQGLTHDGDYLFCNRLGAEAKTAGLDGLLAPSARRAGGTNVPVFARRAISNPGDPALVAMTCDPSTGEVLLNEA